MGRHDQQERHLLAANGVYALLVPSTTTSNFDIAFTAPNGQQYKAAAATLTDNSGSNVLYLTATTATTVTVGGPIVYGQPAKVSATVTGGGVAAGANGTVSFYENTTLLAGNVPVNSSGQASFNTSTTLAAGAHLITADYTPASVYASRLGFRKPIYPSLLADNYCQRRQQDLRTDQDLWIRLVGFQQQRLAEQRDHRLGHLGRQRRNRGHRLCRQLQYHPQRGDRRHLQPEQLLDHLQHRNPRRQPGGPDHHRQRRQQDLRADQELWLGLVGFQQQRPAEQRDDWLGDPQQQRRHGHRLCRQLQYHPQRGDRRHVQPQQLLDHLQHRKPGRQSGGPGHHRQRRQQDVRTDQELWLRLDRLHASRPARQRDDRLGHPQQQRRRGHRLCRQLQYHPRARRPAARSVPAITRSPTTPETLPSIRRPWPSPPTPTARRTDRPRPMDPARRLSAAAACRTARRLAR